MSYPTEYLWSQFTHEVPWENICPEGVEHHTRQAEEAGALPVTLVEATWGILMSRFLTLPPCEDSFGNVNLCYTTPNVRAWNLLSRKARYKIAINQNTNIWLLIFSLFFLYHFWICISFILKESFKISFLANIVFSPSTVFFPPYTVLVNFQLLWQNTMTKETYIRK